MWVHFIYALGVAVGTEFCHPESPAISDPSIWIVTVVSGGKYCFYNYRKLEHINHMSIKFMVYVHDLKCGMQDSLWHTTGKGLLASTDSQC